MKISRNAKDSLVTDNSSKQRRKPKQKTVVPNLEIPVEDMSEQQAKVELKQLSKEILAHDKRYYQEQNSAITDAQYDALVIREKAIEDRFPQIVQKKSRSKRVGFDAKSKLPLAQVQHMAQLLSLDNAFDTTDVRDWVARTQQRLITADAFKGTKLENKADEELGTQMHLEPKIDGLSIALLYQDGAFVRAATRGNGLQGEDVTRNVVNIPGFPFQLTGSFPTVFEVRGEVYLPLSAFQEINAERTLLNQACLANPRNSASGFVRSLTPNGTLQQKLDFFAYEITVPADDPFRKSLNTQSDAFKLLKKWGFRIPSEARVGTTMQEIEEFHKHLESKRPNLNYEIDGVVLKVNDLKMHAVLGSTARAPRWALAFKFSAATVVTEVESIIAQVGRTGALTPVANLKPVMVGGARVSRATLHNYMELKRKDIRPGDKVLIRRAGDVIPEVIEVVTPQEDVRSEPISPPCICPVCGGDVKQVTIKEGSQQSVVLRCLAGLQCSAQVVLMLHHFSSRKALDITGLGAKKVEQLVKAGWLVNIADIFSLEERNKRARTQNESTIEGLNGWGEKSAQKLFGEIGKRAADGVTLGKFIYALGIPSVGQEIADRIGKHFMSFDRWFMAMKEASKSDEPTENFIRLLQDIPGVGDTVSKALALFFTQPANMVVVENLSKVLNIQAMKTPANESAGKSPVNAQEDSGTQDGLSKGARVLFTGKLAKMSRLKAEGIAETLGYIPVDSISKQTSALIVGDRPGGKLEKAKNLGIRIVTEEDWYKMCHADDDTFE